MTAAPPPRIYLVTPPRLDPADWAPLLARLLAGQAVACVRLDLGTAPEDDWRQAANHLIGPCHDADVPLVVAGHPRLVEPLGLDGVHLGPGGGNIRKLRKEFGPDRIIGAFAGASRHVAMSLAEAGADYVALGPVGDTGALGPEDRADDDLFAWWAEMIETPVVAEGGLTPADAARLAPHTDFIVPGPGLWQAADPVAALAEYVAALGEAGQAPGAG